MNRISHTFPAFFLFCILTFAAISSAEAGWVISQEDQVQGRVEKTIIYIEKNRMRSDADSLQTSLILDWDKDLLINVSHQQKLFVENKLSEMQARMRQTLEMMQTPDTQGRFTVEETSEHAEVSGYPVTKLVLLHDGKPDASFWVSDQVKDKELIETYQKFIGMMGANPMMAGIFQGFKQIYKKGYPLKIELGATAVRPQVTITITKLEKKKLPADTFVPPKSYQKKTMMELMQMVQEQMGEQQGQQPGLPAPPDSVPTPPATPAPKKTK